MTESNKDFIKRSAAKNNKKNPGGTDSNDLFSRKKKVTLDTNVILSGLMFDSKTCMDAIEKSTTDDQMMMTNIIYAECLQQTKKQNSPKTEAELKEQMRQHLPDPTHIDLPPDTELKKMYTIRDDKDLKILYSAEATRSEVLVTGDKDFYESNFKGPKNVKILKPHDYLESKPTRRRSFRK